MKVSFILPIYNVEKYLDECMLSLLNQTLKDIEIILVDDESPDNCPKMRTEYLLKNINLNGARLCLNIYGFFQKKLYLNI